MTAAPLLLGGCGILRREVETVIARRGWHVETRFFDSALHCDLERLGKGVSGLLRSAAHRDLVVFYGACHPLLDDWLTEAGRVRTAGQNCVEMLLGPQRFHDELAAGAYFLLEEWAHRWPEVMRRTFGENLRVTREIFSMDRTHLLAIRTPCSGDFGADAAAAAALVGLPLRWTDASLDHLERVLAAAVETQGGAAP